LCLYTDGVPEFKSPAGEQFGEDRLRQFMEANHGLRAEQFVENLTVQLWKWAEKNPGVAPLDDLTILAIDLMSR
jgi:serine phosphatase RsbU (regulator of sigma subunit)